ncbi:hypothetical protein E2562_038741 [Oryza meyeriana var. granulata]|uniref:DUF629 domain-containing protein n=1 Tax=Oryza meyeriana var. granulata TaxID=110450 RepID=A0A6G1CAL5_9ORYZ|nr:hypothetical protein E2562_038741 [Oryza meyeriana var. granulata]
MAPDLDDVLLLRAEAEAALRLHREDRRDEALSRAMDLAVTHNSSPLALILSGDLNMIAYCQNRRSDAALAGRQAKFAAACYKMSLDVVPGCVETFAAYGEALTALGMYRTAWDAFTRAAAIAHPADPAAHRLGYGRSSGSTKGERVEMAKAKLRRAIDCYANARCEDAVAEVLGAVEHVGAASAVHGPAKLADRFPSSARAQCLPAYVCLELSRGATPAATAKTLRRALAMLDNAAGSFDRSLMVALFRAKLLACLHDYDAAEVECRRALAVDNPDDPAAHDIPLGSVIGEEYDDRVSCLREQFIDVQKKLVLLAAEDWESMNCEKQGEILSVSIDKLHEHYSKIDQIAESTISDALRFSRRHESWRFWICARSSGHCAGKKFLDTASLLDHLCNKHPDELWENLESFLDPKLCENASQDGCSFDEACSEMQDLWLKFTKLSVFDYREAIMPLARMYQWKELKKCIAEDGSIAAWSVDAIFAEVSHAGEENVSAEHGSLDKNGHESGENQVTNKSDNLKT